MGANSYRDYTVDLKPFDDNLDRAQALPSLAHTRIKDFYDSVYVRFAVRGGGKYYLRVAPNYSLNTTLTAVMIDRLRGPASKWDAAPLPFMGTVDYGPPAVPKASPLPGTPPASAAVVGAAQALWSALDRKVDDAGAVALQQPYRLLAYRAVAAGNHAPVLLANWRWKLPL